MWPSTLRDHHPFPGMAVGVGASGPGPATSGPGDCDVRVPLLDGPPLRELIVWCAGRVDGNPGGGSATAVAIPNADLFAHRLSEALGVGSVCVGPKLVCA